MSRFLIKGLNNDGIFSKEIDFDDAIRLPDGGSTCDIYRTKWQRREVFVKRLKPEYRTNPLYLDALDKEYEIGVSLKHPSLPDYRWFNRDYIVLDYIDGTTLADMIKQKDPWLTKETNIVRLLRELVEVTGYLHRHNVTHCDIKPDNIMITANNRNLVLIDLDKCYTDSLNDTSGDPSKYGVSSEKQGRACIDFHGIGMIVEKLKEEIPDFYFGKYKEFVKECYRSDVIDQDLMNILDYKSDKQNKKFYWIVTFAPFCVALTFGLVLWLTQGKDGYEDSYGADIPVSQTTDTIQETPPAEPVKNDELENENKTVTEKIIPSPLTQEQIHEQAKERAAQLDKRIQPLFDELNIEVDNMVSLSNSRQVTGSQLLDSLKKHAVKEDDYIQETFAILNDMYPDLSDRAACRVMAYSKVYTGYKRRTEPILRELGYKVKSEVIGD